MDSNPSPTPEFVRWTLVRRCALREETDAADPEQTERQLRVLRAYADALFAGRCQAGICVDEALEKGFRADEVLHAYGGPELIAAQCPGCPANLLRDRTVGNLAGCFGWLILNDALQAAITNETGKSPLLLWIAAAPDRDLLARHDAVLAAVTDHFAEMAPSLVEYRAAMRLALHENIPLAWRLYPRGQTDGITWTTVTHCPICKSPLAPHARRCLICGFVGRPAPERTRKARGARPYVPLKRFLGAEGARGLIARFRNL